MNEFTGPPQQGEIMHDRPDRYLEQLALAGQAFDTARELLNETAPDSPLREAVETLGKTAMNALEENIRQQAKIDNLVRYAEELEHESNTDAMTGIGNRRAFRSHLDVMEADHNGNFTIAILDLDGLKAANDKGGHEAGDELIRAAADALKESGGTAYRTGGDEFAVIVEERVDTEHFTKALHDLLAESDVKASIGARNHEPGEDLSSLLAKTDEMMYQEKLDHTVKTIEHLLPEARGSLWGIHALLAELQALHEQHVSPRTLAKYLEGLMVIAQRESATSTTTHQ